MSDEGVFLASIRAHPQDDLRRLVYADWLDEHVTDEARVKAEYLRLNLHLMRSNVPQAEYVIGALRLQELAEGLELEWKATVSRLPIERCGVHTTMGCPKYWDELSPTSDPCIRVCWHCHRPVQFRPNEPTDTAPVRLSPVVFDLKLAVVQNATDAIPRPEIDNPVTR